MEKGPSFIYDLKVKKVAATVTTSNIIREIIDEPNDGFGRKHIIAMTQGRGISVEME